MKTCIWILFFSLAMCLLLSSCSTLPSERNASSVEPIRFMPYSRARGGHEVLSIHLNYCMGSGIDKSLSVKTFYAVSNGKKTLRMLQIMKNGGEWRAVESENELCEVRAMLAAACKSTSFQYYEIAEEIMLKQLHIYHVIRTERALLDASAYDMESLPPDKIAELKSQQELVDSFSSYYRLYLSYGSWRSVHSVANDMLELLLSVTVDLL